MTTLGTEHKKNYKGWRIVKSISGDLSYSYSVYSPKGRRYNASTLAIAKKTVNRKKQYKNQNYGFLKPKAAKPYLRHAYGEYAASLRKRKK